MENKETVIKQFETLLERLMTIQLKIEIKRELNKILENINKDLAEICSIYKNEDRSPTEEEREELIKKLGKHQVELRMLMNGKNKIC